MVKGEQDDLAAGLWLDCREGSCSSSEAKEAGNNHGALSSGEVRSQDAEQNTSAALCKSVDLSRMAGTWRFD